MSVSAVLYPRWPPLLKIESSSNGQNCSILSQNVSKFELYKHNDELFNIYYGIFYELWTFTDFDRLCKLEKRGDEIKKKSSLKLLSQSQPNFAEMILRWSPFKIVSVSTVLYPRWPPLLKIEMSSKVQNCSILSQKVPKFELYKHNDELFNIYYGIFYELWTFADFDRFCKLEKRGMELNKSSPLKLLSQSQPNFAEMILRWSPFKIVSVSAVLYPRCPPLLKIEISSNGQNCSILSQKVPKFELYKHNDELFNIYYGIFYELWTFTDFDRLCKLEKRGDEIKKKSSLKLLSQSQPNFAEMILRWSPFKIVSVSTVLYPRWPPLLKIEISSKVQICSILSQKVPKFELYKHNDELFNIYYGIFYELWTFADFDRFCKLEKRGMELKKSSPLKLLSQSQPNFAKMILRWSPFKIVSVSAVLYPRCPPLLKMEISSNGQNCSILSQKVPKFELYKHNDELFNIYYGIFYELWTFTDFDRLCKLEKRGDEIKKKSSLKLLSQSQPNFAEMILRWSPFKIVSVSTVLYPIWPPLLKIEISSKVQNCSILSQKVPKFELYKHNDELFNIYYGFFMNFEILPILTDYAI